MHLDGGAAVKAKRLGLPVLQVNLQNTGHEQQGVVLHWVLQKQRMDGLHMSVVKKLSFSQKQISTQTQQ